MIDDPSKPTDGSIERKCIYIDFILASMTSLRMTFILFSLL